MTMVSRVGFFFWGELEMKDYFISGHRLRLSEDGTLSEYGFTFGGSKLVGWTPVQWSELERGAFQISSQHELWPLLQADRERRGLEPLQCPLEREDRNYDRLVAMESQREASRQEATERARDLRLREQAAEYGFTDLNEFTRVCRVVRAITAGVLR